MWLKFSWLFASCPRMHHKRWRCQERLHFFFSIWCTSFHLFLRDRRKRLFKGTWADSQSLITQVQHRGKLHLQMLPDHFQEVNFWWLMDVCFYLCRNTSFLIVRRLLFLWSTLVYWQHRIFLLDFILFFSMWQHWPHWSTMSSCMLPSMCQTGSYSVLICSQLSNSIHCIREVRLSYYIVAINI